MILPPYYFHFDDEALLQYYDHLAREINGPIYIYNFPDNTGYTIAPKTVVKLAKLHSNIVGMKDTISGMDHTRELIKTVKFELPEFGYTPVLMITLPTMSFPAEMAALARCPMWCPKYAPPGSGHSGRTIFRGSPMGRRLSTA